jgi:y4mF family transcriptional regulator
MSLGSDDPYSLGVRLRQRREHLGMTQAHVADLAGISRQLLVRIESGHPRAELGKVMAVVRALGAEVVLAEAPKRSGLDLDALLDG